MLRSLIVICATLFSTMSYAAKLDVSNAQMREFIPGAGSSAAYFTLVNNSKQAQTLIAASIDGIGRVEIHQHSHSNGMMKMQKLEQLRIPAGNTVTFQPGGLHLMLFEPKKALQLDQSVALTLTFKSGESVTTKAIVVKTVSPKMQHHHHHH